MWPTVRGNVFPLTPPESPPLPPRAQSLNLVKTRPPPRLSRNIKLPRLPPPRDGIAPSPLTNRPNYSPERFPANPSSVSAPNPSPDLHFERGERSPKSSPKGAAPLPSQHRSSFIHFVPYRPFGKKYGPVSTIAC